MLPLVINSAAIVQNARVKAGLSRRALAAKAGVPTSTVSRIESGGSDPTLTMLGRLVEAAGNNLVVESRPREGRLTLAELATAFDEDAGRLRIDWTRLRAFVDRVEQHPEDLAEAIADPPASTVPLLNAILAALAEQLSDEYDIERPRWTRAFGPLEDPWSPPSTPRMRAAFEETTPEAFRRRNLVLSRSALFRSVLTSSD
jgi:transcriptional regulator with XRE-family HTH domain